MRVVFWADVSHDDETQALVITDAYPAGTRSLVGMAGHFVIPPNKIIHHQIAAFVHPVKAERGQPFETRFAFVDQFSCKHKTQKIVFKWVGRQPPIPPSAKS